MAQFTKALETSHCIDLRKIFRYFKGSNDLGIRYSSTATPNTAIAYCATDYANDSEGRRSRSGYVIFLNGRPIIWGSHKQIVTTLSTA
jgi:hypothetical protein